MAKAARPAKVAMSANMMFDELYNKINGFECCTEDQEADSGGYQTVSLIRMRSKP